MKRGQLQPLLSDVYLYGRNEQDPLTLAMAVVLHLRGDGIVSAEHATWIWGFSDTKPADVTVTLAGRNTEPIPGVILHRVAAIHPDDIRHRHHIPLTSPARSLIDFASSASLPRAESALAMFRRQQHAADAQIRASLARLPANHAGAPLIRKLLALPPGELALTKSLYERKLRRLLKQANLAMPVSNQVVGTKERDLVWPVHRLIVEFDGWIVHRDTFRDDRARDAEAAALGWTVIRLTADRVDSEPWAVIAELSAALAVRAAA